MLIHDISYFKNLKFISFHIMINLKQKINININLKYLSMIIISEF